MHWKGEGVDKDFDQGYQYIIKAAELGFDDAIKLVEELKNIKE
jgi:TPR repeat protein